MPGICGVVSNDGRAAQYVEPLTRVNELAGVKYVTESYVTDDCAVMTFSPSGVRGGGSLGRSADGETLLLLEGEVFNLAELIKRVSVQDGTEPPQVLLSLYARYGANFLKFLDGEFNVVIVDRRKRSLSLFSDHLASRPMYYWHGHSEFLFGSEKKYLLVRPAGRVELDPVGLLQPFVHHHNLGDRTFIAGLKRLEPATQLVFDAGSISLRRYGGLFDTKCSSARSQELQEIWRDKLLAATHKRIRNKDRLLISLSAGLDSRAVACSLDRAVRPVWARTWGVPGSLEIEYASRIADKLGFQHLLEDPRDYDLSVAVARIVWRTEGETQFRNGLSIFTHRQMKELGDYVMGGWLGDISSGGHLRPFMLVPAQRAAFVQKVYRWYSKFGHNELRNVFTQDFLATNLPLVREAFGDSFRKYIGVPNSRAYELWDLQNRQTRMTVSSMPTDSHMFGKVRPFFDRDYLDFVMSVPLKWRIGQSLYKSVIHDMGPEIRDIPNSNTNVSIGSTPTENLYGYVRSAVAGVGRKAMRRVRPSYTSSLKRRAAMDLGSRVRDDVGLRGLIESYLRSANFDDSVFDTKKIREMLDEHYLGLTDHSILIGIVVTAFVALDFFCRTVDRCPPQAEPL